MKAGYIIILKFDNPASLIKLSSSDCNKNKNNNIEEIKKINGNIS